eukprot:TRINITY_DN1611_c0_g1_i7.p1 TRINITY_DN1611_c0_g1~~TRINITY_DN1611_c0_g1_i7.p1  ORF type:complete len:2287 (+),score=713.24 TRINITY_DN1611_c0_g1_i7:154-6861(+)
MLRSLVGSEMCIRDRWKLLPAFRTRQLGDGVLIDDHVFLQCERFPELSVSCEPTEMNHVHGSGFQAVHCSTDDSLHVQLQVALFAREQEKENVLHGNDVIRLFQKQDSASLTVMLKPNPSRNPQIMAQRFESPDEFVVVARVSSGMDDMQHCLSLWKVENFDQFNGESLTYSPAQRFRLRNVGTGFYLSFSKSGAELEHAGAPKRMELQLTGLLENATLFWIRSESDQKDPDHEVQFQDLIFVGAPFEGDGEEHVYWLHVNKTSLDLGQNRTVTGSLNLREEDAVTVQRPSQQTLENLYVMIAGKKTIGMFLKYVDGFGAYETDAEEDADVKDAHANKLLQCIEHLAYRCDPEGDKIYETDTQNLFQDLGVIGLLLQLLQKLAIKTHFDDPVQFAREIAVCHNTTRLLTEASRDNAGNGSLLYWASQQLVQYELETSLDTADTLAQIYSNNERVIQKVTPQFLEQNLLGLFSQPGKAGRQPRYLKMLSSLCICNDQAVLKNQCMIANMILVKYPNVLLQLVQEGEPSIKETSAAKIRGILLEGLRLQIIDSELSGGVDVVFEHSTGPMALTRMYFWAQVEFLASLCQGRNEQAAMLVFRHQPIYSFDHVLLLMTHKLFPADVRTQFARLMLVLHLDSFKLPEEWKFPLLMRSQTGQASDYYSRQELIEVDFPGKQQLSQAVMEFFSDPDLGTLVQTDTHMMDLAKYFAKIAFKLLKFGFMDEPAINVLAAGVLSLLHDCGGLAGRKKTVKPKKAKPCKRLAKLYERLYEVSVDPVKLLHTANEQIQDHHRSSGDLNQKLFQFKASLCRLLDVMFDIRLDQHLAIVIDKRQDLSVLRDSMDTYNRRLSSTKSYRDDTRVDFLTVMFDLVLHQHAELSQLAMCLAARYCLHLDEIEKSLTKMKLVQSDASSEILQEVTQNQEAALYRMAFEELQGLDMAFELLDLYAVKIMDIAWMQHAGSKKVKRMVQCWLKVVALACIEMPNTQLKCMKRLDKMLELMGFNMGVIDVIEAMLDHRQLREDLTEAHIGAVCSSIVKAFKADGRMDRKYVNLLKQMLGKQDPATGRFVSLNHVLQVAVMNQLMQPEVFEIALKPVFDRAKVDEMIEVRDFTGDKFTFCIDMMELLSVASQGNEAVRAQCRGLIRGDRICDLLEDTTVYQNKLPATLQRVLLRYLMSAYVQAADFSEQLELQTWSMVLNRLSWALEERVINEDPAKSLLVTALVPLLNALYLATKKKPNFGFVFQDHSRLTELTRLIDMMTASPVLNHAPSAVDMASAILRVHKMLPKPVLTPSGLQALRALDGEEAEEVRVLPSSMERILVWSDKELGGIVQEIRDDSRLQEMRSQDEACLLETLITDFMRVPHFCVFAICLHHIAEGQCLAGTEDGLRSILDLFKIMLSEETLGQAGDLLKKGTTRNKDQFRRNLQRIICYMDPSMVYTKKKGSYGILVRACSNVFRESEVDFSCEMMKVMYAMLRSGDPLVQKSLFEYFHGTHSPWVLYYFQQCLREVRQVLDARHDEVQIRDVMTYDRANEVLMMMAQLCENHYTDFQIYMDSPGLHDNVRGVSLLKEAVKILTALEPLVETGVLQTPMVMKHTVLLYRTLTEALQGPCEANQIMLIHTKLCVVSSAILRWCDCTSYTNDLVTNIINTLQALLEGPKESRTMLVPDMIQLLDWTALQKVLDEQFDLLKDGEHKNLLAFDVYILVRTLADESTEWQGYLEAWGLAATDKYDFNRYDYLEAQVGSIEISRNGCVETILFPLPKECFFISDTVAGRHERGKMLADMEPGVSCRERLHTILSKAKYLENVMLHRYTITKLVGGWFNNAYFILHPVATLTGLVVNVFMISYYDATRDSSGKINTTETTIETWVEDVISFLNIGLILASFSTFAVYWLTGGIPVMETKYEASNTSAGPFECKALNPFQIIGLLRYFCCDPLWVYHLAVFLIAVLGAVVSRFFLSLCILDVISHSYMMRAILATLAARSQTIAVSLLLICTVTYLYSVLAFNFFREDYFFEDRYTCETLLQCFTTTINYGLRSPGGVADVLVEEEWDSSTYWSRAVFDLTFYILVILLLLNVILGVIIDAFAALRSKNEKLKKEQRSRCLICDIKRTKFENLSSVGFQTHVKKEHNLWNYVFFIFHTRRKAIEHLNEFTGPELYVYNCVQRQDVLFFPVKQAAMLQSIAKNEQTELDERVEAMEQQMSDLTEFHAEAIKKLHLKLTNAVSDLQKLQHTNTW